MREEKNTDTILWNVTSDSNKQRDHKQMFWMWTSLLLTVSWPEEQSGPQDLPWCAAQLRFYNNCLGLNIKIKCNDHLKLSTALSLTIVSSTVARLSRGGSKQWTCSFPPTWSMFYYKVFFSINFYQGGECTQLFSQGQQNFIFIINGVCQEWNQFRSKHY